MEAFFIKTPNSTLVPASDQDRELLNHIKIGSPTKMSFKRVRNYAFHKKYFALLNLAFDYWEPPEHGEGSALAERLTVERNFDRFRKDVIIRAGYYEATYRLNGDVRIEAKSISFDNMSEDEFGLLYGATIDAIVKHVLTQYTGDELRSVVEQIDGFE